ncbi:MAG: GTPase Der, partial [Parcubacteria group bacterium GW2011_GWC2_45_7]
MGNKAETQKWRDLADDPRWQRLRLGQPRPISAATGIGVGDLLDLIFKYLNIEIYGGKASVRTEALPPYPTPDLRIAIIGKPNVGKSSLLNKILGEERVIVSPIPHTTREPQDTRLDFKNKHILLIDTAGIRKKAKIEPGMEKAGVDKTWNILKRSDVALFVIDGESGIDEQDKHLAGLIHEEGKGVIIVVNKWDLLGEKPSPSPLPRGDGGRRPGEGRTTREGNLLMKQIHFGLPGLTFAPVVFISALTGHGVQKLLPLA